MKLGDRVSPNFKQSWIGGEIVPADNLATLGGAIDGVLAETAVIDEAVLVHMPAGLSYEEAATLPCAAVTAWSALLTASPVTADDTVLVLATGGVTIFAVQFAKGRGRAGDRHVIERCQDRLCQGDRCRALRELCARTSRSRGIGVGSRQAFEATTRAIQGNRSRPVIDRVFEFEEAPAAYRHLEAAGHIGKVVIRIG